MMSSSSSVQHSAGGAGPSVKKSNALKRQKPRLAKEKKIDSCDMERLKRVAVSHHQKSSNNDKKDERQGLQLLRDLVLSEGPLLKNDESSTTPSRWWSGYDEIEYIDGDHYAGHWQEGLKHGHGKYLHKKTGAVYEGDWRANLRHGKGKLTNPGGICYEGDWCNNQKNGFGAYTSKDMVYEGQWKHNKRDGKGVLKWSSGVMYEGDFVNEMAHGQGKMTFPDGNVYEGQFQKGLRDGWGSWTEPHNGLLYRGQFRRNSRTGIAMLRKVLPTSTMTYYGQFSNGRFEGRGVFYHESPDKHIKYEGDFHRNKFEGLGRLTILSSSPMKMYEGHFKNSNRDGDGQVLLCHDRTVLKAGVWKQGNLVDKADGVTDMTNPVEEEEMLPVEGSLLDPELAMVAMEEDVVEYLDSMEFPMKITNLLPQLQEGEGEEAK